MRKCVRGLDGFGHQIKLNYKGEEAYNSTFGGTVTLAIYALTLILIVKSAQEIFIMKDPDLTEFTKALNREERADLVPILHEDYDLVVGFTVDVENFHTREKASIPPEIGRWTINTREYNKEGED